MSPNSLSGESVGRFWTHWVLRFLHVLTLVILLSGGFVGMLFEAPNRQAWLWETTDTLALFGFFAWISLLATMGIYLMDRWTQGRFVQTCRHWIFLLWTIAIIQLIQPAFIQRLVIDDVFYVVLLLTGLGLSLWSWHRPSHLLLGRLWRGNRILFFLPVVLLFNLLRFPSLSESRDFPIPPLDNRESKGPPVILISFDSIAWIDCTDAQGLILPELSAMRAFQEESVDFSNARSPGRCTLVSMPNFLLQRDPAVWNQAVWTDDLLHLNIDSHPSNLWHLAQQEDYRTSILGMYLPYKQMFGPLLDQALILARDGRYRRTWLPLPKPHRDFAVNIIQNFRGPFPERWTLRFPHLAYAAYAYNHYYIELHQLLQTASIDFIRQGLGNGDFTFIEFPLPHYPYIHLADGTYAPRQASYQTQLAYSSRLLGEFLDAIKTAGLYDRSWILFTSDHGDQYTPHAENNHVPLLIKPPAGTYSPQRVDTPVRMWEMGPFFQSVFRGEPAKQALSRLTPKEGIDSHAQNM